MWLPTNIIAEVDALARIYYIGMDACVQWNKHRHADELRLLTGWCWSSRDGASYRQGFKTQTVCYRDAYYTLIRHEVAPISRPRLRILNRNVA